MSASTNSCASDSELADQPNGHGVSHKLGSSAPEVLWDALRAIGPARSPGEVLERLLGVLYAKSHILAGRAEVAGFPPLYCSVGAEPSVLRIGSLSYAVAHVQPNLPVLLAEGVFGLHVGTRAASSVLLALHVREDCNWLPALSELVAVAVDRVHLEAQASNLRQEVERPLREVSAVYEIGKAMGSVDLAHLLDMITETAAQVMGAQACSLMRVNSDTQNLSISASFGLSDDIVLDTQVPIGEGIAGRVAQTGEPMILVDARSDSMLEREPASNGSAIVVPMKDDHGQVLGVLSIRRVRPSPDFTQQDLPIFQVIAGQAALAIKNKQLYDHLNQSVSQLSTITNLTQALISHLDLPTLIDIVADNIVDVVKFDRCGIFLLDRHVRRYYPRALRGYRPEVVGRSPVRPGEGVIGLVARKQMPIVETNARTAMQPIRGFARSLGTNAFVAMPIVSKGQTIGVIVADNKQSGRPIRSETLELLETFCNQAALAIENALLYEDREQRYQEMNRLATQTDNILRSMAGAVVVVDAQGRITRWNKAAMEMWRVPEDLAVGRTYGDLVGGFGLLPGEADTLNDLMEQVLSTGKPSAKHTVSLHLPARGATYLNVLTSPLTDQQGDRYGAVQILEDMTHGVLLEAEMARIRRLADIGQLAAKIAHEVRNPLSSIKGAAQLMQKEHEDVEGLGEFLEIIIDEVNGLSRITSELLDFARPLQANLDTANVNEIVDRTLQLLAPSLSERRVRVIYEPDESISPIVCDVKQVEQVARNIVLNAIQAMPDGGALHVATYDEPEHASVGITFTDTGVGIKPERLTVIFQPFYTTKVKGTGLGLAVVSKIMESHGGNVSVESRERQGTTFRVTLPVSPSVRNLPEAVLQSQAPAFSPTLPDL